jgi:hypothetical protein
VDHQEKTGRYKMGLGTAVGSVDHLNEGDFLRNIFCKKDIERIGLKTIGKHYPVVTDIVKDLE